MVKRLRNQNKRKTYSNMNKANEKQNETKHEDRLSHRHRHAQPQAHAHTLRQVGNEIDRDSDLLKQSHTQLANCE